MGNPDHRRDTMRSPTEAPRTRVRASQPPARRRRRLVIGAALVVAVVIIAAAGSMGYAASRLRAVRRLKVDGIVRAGSGKPQTILVAGSDSRVGESAADAQHFGSAGQVAGQRSDVIILIHVDPGAGKASMLSIPRDLFVPIAGSGSSNRINVAFDKGPGELVRTISQDLGITVNHFVQEDFSGLQGVTNAVGGVCMNFPYAARDGAPSGQGNESGLNIPAPGKHRLDGAAALALVRSRYFQYFAGGAWRAEGTGDIGRIERQHVFMRALASKALHSSMRNPFTANAVLAKAVRDVSIDDTFTTIGLVRLGVHLRSLRPAEMPSWTLPYHAVAGYGGYGDVLMPDPSQDAAVIAAWQGYGTSGSPPAAAGPAPGSISVRVLNGSGVAGQAQRTASALRADGFSVTGFATGAGGGAATTVAHAPGDAAAAQVVAAALVGQVRLVSDHTLARGTVVVTTGSALGGVRPAAASPPGAAAGGGAGTAAAAPPAATAPPWDPKPC